MEAFLKYLLNGLTLGGMYALIALGYTMVYGIIKLINFAHGDVLMVGAFLGYFFLATIAYTPLTPLLLFVPATLIVVLWARKQRLDWKGLPQVLAPALPILLVVGLTSSLNGDMGLMVEDQLSISLSRPVRGLQVSVTAGTAPETIAVTIKGGGRVLGRTEIPLDEPVGPQTVSLPDGNEALVSLAGPPPAMGEYHPRHVLESVALYAPWTALLLIPLAIASGLRGSTFVAAVLGGGTALGLLVSHHFPFAMLAAMFYAALLGVSIERFAYKPLRAAPRIAALITAIGVSLFLENAGIIVWGERDKSYDDLNPTVGALLTNKVPPLDLGMVEIGQKELLVLVVTVVMMLALQYLVMKTRIGKAMRAVSMDRDAARLMGINVDATISATFAIGSALAAAAGVLWGLYYNTLNPDMGIIPGIKAFVAAVLGGIGSIPGAMAGGIVMGVAENLVVGYLASSYRDAIAFAILIIILLVRPTGLFGSRTGEKV